MYKRLISLLLIVTLLVGILPSGGIIPASTALAEQDTYTMSAAELRRIENMSGYTNSRYYEGMSFSPNMTAWQMYCWAKEFQSNELSQLVSQAQMLVEELEEQGKTKSSEADEIYGLKAEVDAISRAFLRYVYDFDDLIMTISSSANVVKNSDMPATAVTAAYRNIQSAGKKLKTLMDELSGKVADYQRAYADRYDEMSDLHQSHSNEELPSARAAARQLSQATPFANLRSLGFYIDVLRANEAGFTVHDEDKQPIEHAHVTLSWGNTHVDGYTDAHGIYKFDTGVFGHDEDGYFEVAILIEADGMRVYESCRRRMMAGDAPLITMTKDDGTSYIQRADFQHMDVLHDQDVIYVTPANDAVQPMAVYVHRKPGSDGDVIVRYTDGSGSQKEKKQHFTASSEDIMRVEFNDYWCRDVLPDTSVDIVLVKESANGEEKCSSIPTTKAAVENPAAEIKAPNYVPGTNLGFSIPINRPGLKSVDVGFNIPVNLPVQFAAGLDGSMMYGIAFSGIKQWKDDTEASWKFASAGETREKIGKVFKELRSKPEGQSDKSNSRFGDVIAMGEFFILKYQIGFRMLGYVKVDRKTLKGTMDNYFEVSADGTVSYCGNLGLPFMVGFDFGMGISGGVRFKTTFNLKESVRNVPLSHVYPGNWENVRAQGKSLDIYFGWRFSIASYVGIGVKNVACLYIKGFVGVSVGVHIMPMGDDKLVIRGDMSAGLQAVVEALFGVVSTKFNILGFSRPIPDDKKALQNEEIASVEVEGVRPNVESMSDRFNMKSGMKVVHFADKHNETSYFGLFLEPNEDGLNRLKYVWSSYNDTEIHEAYTVPPIVGSTWFNVRYDDFYVYDFRMVDISESGQHRKTVHDQGVVGIAVLMARRSEDVDDPENPGHTIPGKTYVEMDYVYIARDSLKWKVGAKTDLVFTGKPVDLKLVCNWLTRHHKWGPEDVYSMTLTWRMMDEPLVLYAYMDELSVSAEDDHDTRNIDVSSSRFTLQKIDMSESENVKEIKDFTAYAHQGELSFDEVKLSFLFCYFDGEMWHLQKSEYIPTRRPFEYSSLKHKELTKAKEINAFYHFYNFDEEYILILQEPNEQGKFDLYLHKPSKWSNPLPLGIFVSPADYYIANLGSTLAMYFLNAISPSAKEDDTRYAYQAIYLAQTTDNKLIATKPFTLAVFDKDELDPINGVTSIHMLPQPARFLDGMVTANKTNNPEDGTTIKRFKLHQTPMLSLKYADLENPLVKVGQTVNIMMDVKNTGNIPVSAFDVHFVGTDVNDPEKKPVQLGRVRVSCDQPAESKAMQRDPDGKLTVVATGEDAVSQYARVGENEKNFWLLGRENGTSLAAMTKTLMPDEIRTYRVPFTIPAIAEGKQYEVEARISTISTMASRDAEGRYDSTSAWVSTLQYVDDEQPLELTVSNEEPEMLTFVFPENAVQLAKSTNGNPAESPITIVAGELPLDADLNDLPVLADPELFSAYALTSQPSSMKLNMDYIDLELQASMYNSAEGLMVHMSVANRTNVPVQNIMLKVILDGEPAGSYNLNGNEALTAAHTISMDVPLDVLLQGRTCDSIQLEIGSEMEENYTINNTWDFLLNNNFAVAKQPENCTIEKDGYASFEVIARGGQQPYAYQWQLSSNGRNGNFANIDGATDRMLFIYPVAEADNGNFYRCVVTDANGNSTISDPALLLVKTEQLFITAQPEDYIALDGRSAQFSVQAAGGSEPYTYQWQVLRNGEWLVITGATADTLHLDKVTGADHGNQYRCIVTDMLGRTVISNAAKLSITVLPPTGDSTNLPLLAGMLVLSLGVLVVLLRRRKTV